MCNVKVKPFKDAPDIQLQPMTTHKFKYDKNAELLTVMERETTLSQFNMLYTKNESFIELPYDSIRENSRYFKNIADSEEPNELDINKIRNNIIDSQKKNKLYNADTEKTLIRTVMCKEIESADTFEKNKAISKYGDTVFNFLKCRYKEINRINTKHEKDFKSGYNSGNVNIMESLFCLLFEKFRDPLVLFKLTCLIERFTFDTARQTSVHKSGEKIINRTTDLIFLRAVEIVSYGSNNLERALNAKTVNIHLNLKPFQISISPNETIYKLQSYKARGVLIRDRDFTCEDLYSCYDSIEMILTNAAAVKSLTHNNASSWQHKSNRFGVLKFNIKYILLLEDNKLPFKCIFLDIFRKKIHFNENENVNDNVPNGNYICFVESTEYDCSQLDKIFKRRPKYLKFGECDALHQETYELLNMQMNLTSKCIKKLEARKLNEQEIDLIFNPKTTVVAPPLIVNVNVNVNPVSSISETNCRDLTIISETNRRDLTSTGSIISETIECECKAESTSEDSSDDENAELVFDYNRRYKFSKKSKDEIEWLFTDTVKRNTHFAKLVKNYEIVNIIKPIEKSYTNDLYFNFILRSEDYFLRSTQYHAYINNARTEIVSITEIKNILEN